MGRPRAAGMLLKNHFRAEGCLDIVRQFGQRDGFVKPRRGPLGKRLVRSLAATWATRARVETTNKVNSADHTTTTERGDGRVCRLLQRVVDRRWLFAAGSSKAGITEERRGKD